jgi:hypothetical protein
MKQIILLVGMIATAHAAAYRVCFSAKESPEVRCGDPVSKKTADTFVAQATRDYPNLDYFVDVQSRPVDWDRARWVGAAAALGAGIFDAHTTTQLIAAGGVERNPIYGSHPTAAVLYGTNIGVVVGSWILTDWLRHRHPGSERALDRNMFFSELGVTAVHVAAGLYNETALNRQLSLQPK